MSIASVEVVRDVLNHLTPSYIPFGVYAIDCDLAGEILGRETLIRDKVSVQLAIWEGRGQEIMESIKNDVVELFGKLDFVDILVPGKLIPMVSKNYIPPKVKKLDDSSYETEDGAVYKIVRNTNDIVCVHRPDREYTEDDYPLDQPFEKPDTSGWWAVNQCIDHFSDKKFVIGKAGGWNAVPLPGGMEKGLMDYILRPELIKKAGLYGVEKSCFNDEYLYNRNCHALLIEEDFCDTNGPLLSPEMFREFSLEGTKKRVASLKKLKDHVFFHSCGNTWKLMDMFVEAGLDCYQSLQTGVMDVGELKDAYGRQMAFWGGVAVETMITGTREQVKKNVHDVLKNCSSEGGFILGMSHSLAYGSKYDNFMTMVEEYLRLRDRYL